MKMFSNIPVTRDSNELLRHFSKTYISLRAGLVMLAFTMPFVLYYYGKFRHGLDLQPSMSAYFWAAASESQCATFPMRTIFVGYLFAIGVCLFVYKGLTKLENSLLNAAALCAFTVAIYPERLSSTQDAQLFANCPAVEAYAALPSLPIHYMAAIILFVFLAVVAWFCADKSLKYLPQDHDPNKFRRAYRIIAIAMLLFPFAGCVVAFLLGNLSAWVFFIEAAGVLTFGVYWGVKTYEFNLSRLEIDPVKILQEPSQQETVEVVSEQ